MICHIIFIGKLYLPFNFDIILSLLLVLIERTLHNRTSKWIEYKNKPKNLCSSCRICWVRKRSKKSRFCEKSCFFIRKRESSLGPDVVKGEMANVAPYLDWYNLDSRTLNAARDRVVRRKEEQKLAALIHSPLNLSSLKFEQKVTVVSTLYIKKRSCKKARRSLY